MRHTYTPSSFIFLLYIIIALALFLIMPAYGQTDQLVAARQLSYEGRYTEADSLFSRILAEEPENTEARLGSAYNHSWHHNLEQAQLEFERILKASPGHKEALIGMGYNLAWQGDYANAKYPFLNVLKEYPHDVEAEKGLAYVYLWQGSPDVAMDMFEALRDQDPSNPEFYNALAYAHLQRYETIEARRLVNHAISIDPGNTAAKDIKATLDYAAPFLEADFWGGYSHIEESTRVGLRAIQMSAQISRSFRAMASYDNSMSLDNFYFMDRHLRAETYLAGGVVTWDKTNISRLQFGLRDLDIQGSQVLIIGEQALNLKDRKIVKAGGMYAASNQLPDEWMVYTGINIPVHPRIRLEPLYYISHRALAPAMEHRVALNAQWIGRNGFEIGAGSHFGKVNAGAEQGLENTYGIYIATLIPIHRMVWLEANLRHEQGVAGTYQMAGFGIKMRFEK